MDDVRFPAFDLIVDRRFKGFYIQIKFILIQISEIGDTARVGSETREIKWQSFRHTSSGIILTGNDLCFLRREKDRMESDTFNFTVIIGILWQDDTDFMFQLMQMNSQIAGIGSASGAGQRKMIDHEDFHNCVSRFLNLIIN